jgi:hypothetical protein
MTAPTGTQEIAHDKVAKHYRLASFKVGFSLHDAQEYSFPGVVVVISGPGLGNSDTCERVFH